MALELSNWNRRTQSKYFPIFPCFFSRFFLSLARPWYESMAITVGTTLNSHTHTHSTRCERICNWLFAKRMLCGHTISPIATTQCFMLREAETEEKQQTRIEQYMARVFHTLLHKIHPRKLNTFYYYWLTPEKFGFPFSALRFHLYPHPFYLYVPWNSQQPW